MSISRKGETQLRDLASRLHTCRKSLGLTQKQLGEKACIAQEYICEMERGKKLPSLEVLGKLCGVLGCSADYLLGVSGEKRFDSMSEESLPFSWVYSEIESLRLTEEDLRFALKVAALKRGETKQACP